MKMNPKYIQAQKDGKAPLEYLPLSVLPGWAIVHKHGADKYGIRNWRKDEILMSTYKGAILRHLLAWSEGEDLDPDSRLNHLYHIMACCAVVLDAQMHGKIVDDRTIEESKNNESAWLNENEDDRAQRDSALTTGCVYHTRWGDPINSDESDRSSSKPI